MKPYELINPTTFYAKVDRTPGLGTDGNCHLWRGAKQKSGVGTVTIVKADRQTVNFKAHRVAHWLYYGTMPDDLFCVHACNEISCVNPHHIYLTTRKKGIGQARIMRAIDVTPGQGPTGQCWCFTMRLDDKMGYGSFCDDQGRTVPAHRYMMQVLVGDIPIGMHVLHKCDHPPCCRPDHLFLGTHADNMLDRNLKGRAARTRGHFKLTEQQALAIKRDSRPRQAIADEFGVSPATVTMIKRGRRWLSLPD